MDDAARAKFLDIYERVFEQLWPESPVSLDVPTAFGPTRVYRAGRSQGPPIVLLPGAGGNALMWHRYIRALGDKHPVIAIDTIGEAGASVQQAPVHDGRDGAAWLGEVLTALKVDSAHVVGCSYGGWLAMHHESHHPGRFSTLVLLDPAGLALPGPRFYGWVIAGALAGLAPRALRPRLARLVANSTILETEIMSLIPATARYRRRLPDALVFSDDELRALRTSRALFLLAGRSALHKSRQVADRLARVVPTARVEIVPGAGHALPMDRVDLVTERILQFIAAGDDRTS
ncbi:alpha/beta fold hydrolase [Nonomuraea sp. NPDC000554]|uniref:alpha/beta fold hydrolase n=1 Tax=Nonomuraea sp. NPDC000554 TaxID=3154259 RepID=UPI00331C1BAD